MKYVRGEVVEDNGIFPSDKESGTYVKFIPDNEIFKDFKYKDEYVEALLKNYTFLNTGLTIVFNGQKMHSRNGLLDLLKENMTNEPLYPIIHFTGTDIEIVITHTSQYGEEYYSFVNGQHTTQGGTHLTAFRESVSRTIKEFYGKNFEYSDIRNGMAAAISIKVEEPVFESQTKTRLGSRDMGPNGPTVAKFIGDFIKKRIRQLPAYQRRNSRDHAAQDTRIGERTQSNRRRHETSTGTCQKSEPAQPQTSRLPHPLQRCQRRPPRRIVDIHNRRAFRHRHHHEKSAMSKRKPCSLCGENR